MVYLGGSNTIMKLLKLSNFGGLGFPGGSDSEEPACNARDLGLIPGSGRSPGGHSNPLQYPCLENPMDTGAWWAVVHGSQSRTRLSDSHFHLVITVPSKSL